MIAFALAVGSSLAWGTSDYLAGLRSRRHGALVIAFWCQVSALVVLGSIVTALAVGGVVDVHASTVGLGVVAGAFGAIGLVAFYRALAVGPMTIVPPIAASGVVLPVAWGLVTGGTVSTGAIAGAGLAVAGVVLASFAGSASDAESPTATGATDQVPAVAGRARRGIGAAALLPALAAAACFAIFQIILATAADGGSTDALVATGSLRVGGSCIVGLVILARGVSVAVEGGRASARALVVIGVLDSTANLLFALAVAAGDLVSVAVLGSLYPAVTSGLAHVLLGERASRVQVAGVLLAFGGIALVAGS